MYKKEISRFSIGEVNAVLCDKRLGCIKDCILEASKKSPEFGRRIYEIGSRFALKSGERESLDYRREFNSFLDAVNYVLVSIYTANELRLPAVPAHLLDKAVDEMGMYEYRQDEFVRRIEMRTSGQFLFRLDKKLSKIQDYLARVVMTIGCVVLDVITDEEASINRLRVNQSDIDWAKSESEPRDMLALLEENSPDFGFWVHLSMERFISEEAGLKLTGIEHQLEFDHYLVTINFALRSFYSALGQKLPRPEMVNGCPPAFQNTSIVDLLLHRLTNSLDCTDTDTLTFFDEFKESLDWLHERTQVHLLNVLCIILEAC